MKSKLTVNCGGMFSGKSSELQRQGERHLIANHKVAFVKPALDNRYADEEIVNHKGYSVKAISIEKSVDIFTTPGIITQDVICIDEVQFFDDAIVACINSLLKLGKVVYCSGLDMDYAGKPFRIVADLMAMADEVNKFQAVCSDCGDDAIFSHRLDSESTAVIELGEKDKYKPLCRACYYAQVGER